MALVAPAAHAGSLGRSAGEALGHARQERLVVREPRDGVRQREAARLGALTRGVVVPAKAVLVPAPPVVRGSETERYDGRGAIKVVYY